MKGCCQKVGEYQLDKFRTKGLRFDMKSSIADLVTEVDKYSEDLIVTFINKNYPDSRIVAEESGDFGPRESEFEWVIDPLDGTNNYAHGLPIFSISIALYYRGEAKVGIVHAPYLRETYTAIHGKGSFLNGDTVLEVNSEGELKNCVLGTGFPYDKDSHPANNIDNFNSLLPKIRGVRRFGSSAYDLCLVASGNLNAYWELNLKRWDIAAGMLIVQEAGGTILNFRDDRNYSIIAGNEKICKVIEKEIIK